ncbi:helix-turn-helix transcriptional regulator (plasmid) [Photobacterium sp. GJ3]|uniref:helix-turn-helix domain-containing protein n=1 Tax=Photobacterium sp. GJ3 TaxID=2829502 RepID=UPI001B8B2801|nr:AraC family transcriptional regulator [Photobacterium sp. GJ3]QUJ70487.1 helix-turn-helix transcriptional regulator [Photobacterium sp. GJ3]
MFDLGITDYISSPFIDKELRYRIAHLLSTNFKPEFNYEYHGNTAKYLTQTEEALLLDKNYQLIEKCVEILTNSLSDEIRLENLCRTLGTNRNKINQVFKEYLGMTVFEWIRNQRMRKAAELLESSSLNIVQIAEQVGYMDSNNFSTAFKRAYQTSPSHFRQNYKKYNSLRKNES